MRARKHRLTSVDNARLRLNALVLQHPCEPYGQLLNRIGRHYIYQASQALLRVAGDLDLVGVSWGDRLADTREARLALAVKALAARR